MKKRVARNNENYLPESLSWLPDWKDANLYKDYQHLSYTEWTWEFLRRNDRYRHLRAEIRMEYSKKDIEKAKFITIKSSSDSKVTVFNPKKAPAALEKVAEDFYALYRLSSFPPDSADNKPNISFEMTRIFENLKALRKLELGENELICLIDLAGNLTEQIKALEANLKRRKMAALLKPDSRTQKALFGLYLRVLDGYLAGAKIREIASVIFPRQANNYDNGFAVSKRIKKNLVAAKKLQKNAFRTLPLRDLF